MKSAGEQSAPPFEIEKVRADFPTLAATYDGQPIGYLDSAATAFKPQVVIDRVTHFDAHEYATIHRGAYRLGERATFLYEEARERMARFIGAANKKEIVFTSGATASLNLVAHSWGSANLGKGDVILLTAMEHHANIVPWQVVAAKTGARIEIVPVTGDGELDMPALAGLLSSVPVKVVAFTHVSNVLGAINPVAEICRLARDAGAVTVVDGAQGAPHTPVNVAEMGCDFYVLSSHKMYGPTGAGLLYGQYELLDAMPPFITGGDMIEQVTFEKSTFAKPPGKFEAGTPPISQIIGMGEAAEYLTRLGLAAAEEYEKELLAYGTGLLEAIPGVRIFGKAKEKAAIISFEIDGVHAHDVVTLLDQEGLCLRGGHHCAQPLMEALCVPATARASLAFYNTREELDRLAVGIRKIIDLFS